MDSRPQKVEIRGCIVLLCEDVMISNTVEETENPIQTGLYNKDNFLDKNAGGKVGLKMV